MRPNEKSNPRTLHKTSSSSLFKPKLNMLGTTTKPESKKTSYIELNSVYNSRRVSKDPALNLISSERTRSPIAQNKNMLNKIVK